MEFDSLIDYQFLALAAILLVYLIFPPSLKDFIMASMADLSKQLDNLKRATGIVNRAAADAPKHAAIMDSFEQRMNLNNQNMDKLAEMEKLMAAMDTLGNGGPTL